MAAEDHATGNRVQLGGTFLREAVIIASGVLVYFGVRGITKGDRAEAYANARHVAGFEHHVGIDIEHQLQHAVVSSDTWATIANWIYIYGHWPVIITALILLQRYRPDRYWLLRTAMFISGLVGFAFFMFTPMAPPRFVDPSIVDTVTMRSEGYRVLQPPQLANLYASMPSLHAGWNMLVGIAVFGATKRRFLRAWAVVFPVLMAWAVVVTGNHYVIDVVVGEMVALSGYFGAYVIRARRTAIVKQHELQHRVRDRPSGRKQPPVRSWSLRGRRIRRRS